MYKLCKLHFFVVFVVDTKQLKDRSHPLISLSYSKKASNSSVRSLRTKLKASSLNQFTFTSSKISWRNQFLMYFQRGVNILFGLRQFYSPSSTWLPSLEISPFVTLCKVVYIFVVWESDLEKHLLKCLFFYRELRS